MYETTKSVLQIGWTVVFHFLSYVVASRKLSPQFSLCFSFLTLSVINRFMFHFISFPWGRWSTRPQTHQKQKWLYTTNSGCFHRPNPGSRSCWWASHSLDLAHRQILFNQHNILNVWKFCESFLIFDFSWRSEKIFPYGSTFPYGNKQLDVICICHRLHHSYCLTYGALHWFKLPVEYLHFLAWLHFSMTWSLAQSEHSN